MEYVLLLATAATAGILNAVAGGGSFILLPALVFHGMAPTVANATMAFALMPGYFSALFGFRHDVEAPATLTLPVLVALAAAGGATGAGLLLISGNNAFSAIVPWLMLFATLIFAFRSKIQYATRQASMPVPAVAAALYLTCAYGGYFNGGAGIVIVALLGLLGQDRLIVAVGTKTLFSVVMASISVAAYALFGLIHWPLALFMALGTVGGGWLGARVSYSIPQHVHYWSIVIIGLAMTALMFYG